ncbi:hypothetical protein [Acidiphilium rubrum]|uniref:hypothetical protein n=1 Tax=Acidiphilium rubrum TaxID=526 RepID=UPI002BB79FD3|nr:hypothetical protein [Acidiphilium rubrum]HQT86804.1 hypothetical protein [Acidiphilium rubrum]
MSDTERAENRRRLALGLPADWTEETDASRMTDAEYEAAKARLAVEGEASARRRATRAFIETLKEST